MATGAAAGEKAIRTFREQAEVRSAERVVVVAQHPADAFSGREPEPWWGAGR